MGKIKQLPVHEAQKIAAGQVVDRPANIIKELIENSIDAGATQITIIIDEGGKKLLRIIDNGCGMDAEDAQLCFAKHATSKINCIDELPTITTFGFRGEALASIAAVSVVTLITKQNNAQEGIKVEVREGVSTINPVACPEGTDISVHNLFYNIPARAKFLKSEDTELRHSMQTIHALCFAYPLIHFKVITNGKQILNCPPQDSLASRCTQIWDHAHTQHVIPLETTAQKISLSGVISNHEWFRFDRSAIFFIVNNRWVTNQALGRALSKGFNNVIPAGRHPLACLSIAIDPHLIDINMHPRKEEIKFAHPRIVEQLIQDTVRDALEKNISQQVGKKISFTPHAPTQKDYQMPFARPYATPSFLNTIPNIPVYTTPPTPNADIHASTKTNWDEIIVTVPTPTAQMNVEKENPPPSYNLIGQYRNTYLLLEQDDGLFLIDQHAAHERILYEQFANRFEKVATVNLLFPQLIPCSEQDLAVLESYLGLFQEHGIVIERFGSDQLVVQATPVPLQHVSIQELIKQVIGWIREYEHVDREQFIVTMHDKLRAQMACKAAVKAGDALSREQMVELLEKLQSTPNRFSCPHGRPTGWLLSIDEIEKKFRRKL